MKNYKWIKNIKTFTVNEQELSVLKLQSFAVILHISQFKLKQSRWQISFTSCDGIFFHRVEKLSHVQLNFSHWQGAAMRLDIG